MAIPFYENDEDLPQQVSEEINQVDGPSTMPNNNAHGNTQHWQNQQVHQAPPVSQHDIMAWKILALAMCQALKDHYQQTMANASSIHLENTNNNNSLQESSSTAVIQILPKGQVKPQWN